MDIKTQFKKLKDNWLISLVVLILIFIVGSFNFNNIPNTFNSFSTIDMDRMLSEGSSTMIAPRINYDKGISPEIEERILTQSAYLSIEVRRGKFQEADQKLKDIVKTTDSFLLNENVIKRDTNLSQYYYGTYAIRVETSKYKSVTNQLKELGEIQEFTENIDDITNGYNKLEIEIEAEKERLARYKALYNESTRIEDKLSLIDRIYNQERTIKYYEDRLTNLDEKVEYSNIRVTLSEKHSNYAGIKFISFGTLVNNIVDGVNNLLTIIFFLLPYALLGWLVYYGLGWWRKNRKK